MTTFASLRTSIERQDLNNQKLAILHYVQSHDLKVDEFLQISISSRKISSGRLPRTSIW